MLYEVATQAVAPGGTLSLSTSLINSTGDIVTSGTGGLTLAAGQYLVTFSTDALLTGAGTLGAVLALDGTPLVYSAMSIATADDARLSTTVIVALTEEQTLTVENNTDGTISYDNSVLTVVKLA